MSLTLATVADALIEFILSLLRDPDVAAEFEEDPDHALASRGLHHVGPSDVSAVAPIIIERVHVMHVVPRPYADHGYSPVVHQIKQVTSHLQWIDDRDTIVDQSVNQNIWAEGDVTQTFDNEAIVASGDDAVAAGGDATVDKTWDDSTTITAGDDVNIGNDTDVQVVDDSMNQDTDASTTTDDSTTVVVDDSANEESAQATTDDSHNQTTTVTTQATTTDTRDAASEQSAAPADAGQQADPATVVDDTTSDAGESQQEPEPTAAEQVDPGYDSAAQYVEADLDGAVDDGFGAIDATLTDEGASDDF